MTTPERKRTPVKLVKLQPGAPDIAEFAEDMAQLGPFTAKELAIQYLDQYLAPGEDFDESVEAFTPTAAYYT